MWSFLWCYWSLLAIAKRKTDNVTQFLFSEMSQSVVRYLTSEILQSRCNFVQSSLQWDHSHALTRFTVWKIYCTSLCPGICFRWLLFVCLVIPVLSHTLANNEKVIQVDNFLANVNFSEPKVFYVRNNLDVSCRFNDFSRSINFHVKLFACSFNTPPIQFC